MDRSPAAEATAGTHGFPAALTSFVGRGAAVDEVAGRLAEYRLVTVTGPGGAGKTRLAGEVARRVAARFADGVWLAELASVHDPAQLVPAVAAALGVRGLPLVAAADELARALARRQLLLVLDNCEHVIGAAAELCGRLLLGADEVQVLATSREPLRIAGEVRCRLGPLTLPDPGDLAAAAASEAVTLFAERAQRVAPDFTLDPGTAATVGHLVARLDGLPLAIELAAARVDVLGVAQLLDRIDDRFDLLADGDRLADGRQRSLAAAVNWSYQLLDDSAQRVFRAVSAFPGPFTLDAAGAVAGPGAGRDVLRLVDGSLIVPPRVDPDGRSRYVMLETLRAYGTGLRAEAGEDDQVMSALVGYAADLAEQTGALVHTGTQEVAALRRLDAEEATLRLALAWAMDHDRGAAVRLAIALQAWWSIRGRLASQAPLLALVAEDAETGSGEWCAMRLCLGQLAGQAADSRAALEHFTAVRDALEAWAQPDPWVRSLLLSICLDGRSSALMHLDRVAEAASDGRRALVQAREIGGGLEAMALTNLGLIAWQGGDRAEALRLVRQAQRVPGDMAGALERGLNVIVTSVLTDAGDLAAAEQVCAATVASCREVGDLTNLGALLRHQTILDLRAGRFGDAAAHLREQLRLATQTAQLPMVYAGLDCCGYLCAATGRPAEAVTVWAAVSALSGNWSRRPGPLNPGNRDESLTAARRCLGPARADAAQQRGEAMSLTTATEYARMLAADPASAAEPVPAAEPGPAAGPGSAAGDAAVPAGPGSALAKLSPRECELVTLVAQGRTDAQIAAQLYITVRTVGSHLDRIRDKTGCRRRADLTRLALSAGLV